MKTRTIPIYLIALLIGLLGLWGCKKNFLEEKPQKSLLVPETRADLRALLDNTGVFNLTPGLTYIADGDMQVTDAGYNDFANLQERTSYSWSADIFGSETSFDWNALYQQVFYANVVLEALDKLPDNAENTELRGTALFHRAMAFYQLAQMFTAPYSAAAATTAPGIPLKLSADVNEKAGRGTLAETYGRILTDLRTARALLPVSVSLKSRPSQAAAYALLARTYLAMADYPMAGLYADSCLQLRGELVDYNTVSTTSIRPFPRALPVGTPELIFYSLALDYSFGDSSSPSYFTPEFYSLFAANDLRKLIFFRLAAQGSYKFKGNYAGVASFFSGIATDELYLIRAECAARAGKTEAAMADLNALLVRRYKKDSFTPLVASDAEAALRLIIAERRRELTFRGIRWTDLRRLGADARFSVTLMRTVAGQVYTLEPGSKRYTYPLPPDELRLHPMPQNER